MGHRSRLLDLMCWCLVCILPVSALATEVSPAMVWGTGVVKVNGKLVPGSLTVYAGDKLVTDTDSTATLINKFGTAVLPGDSSIVYGGNNIRMQYGRALIIAQRGTEAVLGNLTITVVNGNARFQMRQTDTVQVLAVLAGSLQVTDGANKVVLTQGEMITRKTGEPTAVAANPPPPDAPAPPPPAAVHAHLPGWVIGTIAAGAAGGIVGGMAAAGAFRPASPVEP